jgi:predicted ATPase/class 3 adenylate cyclase
MRRELPTGTVSLLFTDVEGSTRLLDALGDGYGTVLAEHRRLLRAVWDAHGGVEVDTEGDAFFVAFATAGAAAQAAAHAQRALAGHPWPAGAGVRVRIGIHTGTPRLGESGYWGHDVHYAARIAAAAHGGQVVLSAAAQALAGMPATSLGEHAVKDFPQPQELFQLAIDGAGPDAFPPLRTAAPPPSTLPPTAGDLIGREADLAALTALCTGGARIVSVVGPGGSGKTRVSIELGRRVEAAFADGVAFVALESLAHGDAIPAAVARALGLPELAGVAPIDRVLAHLRDREILLVLDNFEHLLDAAPVVGRLAGAGPGVRIVVSSQAPLRITGEHVVALGPLAVPDAAAAEDTDALAAVPSVALLLERARAAAPGFALTAGNAAAVHELVAQLDGMPLALELAAGRLGLLDPAALVARLDGSLEALGRGARDLPARQRGLRAVLDWTTGLLEPAERDVLARLSVLPGGATVELAEAAFGEVLDALEALLDVGLLRRAPGGRLVMTPPVRRHAGERLAAAGAEAAAREAAAEALARLVERFEEAWPLHVTAGAPVLNAEAANLEDALDWTRHAAPELHARLAAATGWWMNYADRHRLGRGHVEAALVTTEEPRLRARLHEALGTLSLATLDPTASLRAADEWAALGDRRREVSSLFYAVNLLAHSKRDEEAERFAVRAIELARATGEDPLVQLAETALGNALRGQGRVEESLALLSGVLPRVAADSFLVFFAATTLADVELDAERWADALAHYGMAMGSSARIGIVLGELIQAETVALALGGLGRLEDAATVLGVCDVTRRELSTPLPPFVVESRARLERLLDAPTRERLLDAPTRERGLERASAMGMRTGLAWTGALARGEAD